jgi:L-ascorbate metabolism protein UlaG (beta-lactamase superfamily)
MRLIGGSLTLRRHPNHKGHRSSSQAMDALAEPGRFDYIKAMRSRRNRYYQGPPSDHYDGERFFMPGHRMTKGARELLKWQLGGGRQRWPARVENAPQPAPPDSVGSGNLQLTYIGHATVLVQVAGLNIVTDPFFSRRASPVQWVGPRRVRAPGLGLDRLPRIDAVLVSHNHYDHMDLPSLRRLADSHAPRILAPLGNGAILARARRPLEVVEGDWGDRVALADGVSVTFAPAVHWSKRGLHDRNWALWCAFVIETPAGIIYFAGDTGYGSGAHFRAVQDEFGPVRVALLPIGAYEPRWFMHPQHMNPEEAVKAHLDLGAELSVGVHHSTVQLTDEAIDEPAAALARALEQHNVEPERFQVLDPGAGVQIADLAEMDGAVLGTAAE